MTDSTCPECGADRWIASHVERDRDETRRLSQAAIRMAKEAGVKELKSQLLVAANEDHVKRLQRKIMRQARQIVRLEAKLRDAGVKPYAGETASEINPFAEWDAKRGDA